MVFGLGFWLSKGLRVNKVTEFGPSTSSGLSASSSRSGFAVIVGYYKDSRHRNRRAHEPQKDQFIYKQTLSEGQLFAGLSFAIFF